MKKIILVLGVLGFMFCQLVGISTQLVQASDQGETIIVSTYDELVAAIGSNRTILLKPGDYNVGDGLVIEGVTNLKLIGSIRPQEVTHLVTNEYYADVLVFRNSSHVTISNLTIGHDVESKDCLADVLVIQDSQYFLLEHLTLYGSGRIGLNTSNTDHLTMANSIIEDCSYLLMLLKDSTDLVYYNTLFHNTEGGVDTQNADLYFENCQFDNNISYYDYFFDGNGKMTFVDSDFSNNKATYLFRDSDKKYYQSQLSWNQCTELYGSDFVKELVLTGMIQEKYPITMNLRIEEGQVSGFYFYNKYLNPIHLSGNIDENQQISLQEEIVDTNGKTEVTGYFKGQLSDGEKFQIQGAWTNPEQTKKLSFNVSQNLEYRHEKTQIDDYQVANRLPGEYELRFVYFSEDLKPGKVQLLEADRNFYLIGKQENRQTGEEIEIQALIIYADESSLQTYGTFTARIDGIEETYQGLLNFKMEQQNGQRALSEIYTPEGVSPKLWGKTPASTSTSNGKNAIYQNYFYQVVKGKEIRIYDLSDLTHPVLVHTFHQDGAPQEAYVRGSYLYVADTQIGFYIYDLNHPEEPKQVSRFPEVRGENLALTEQFVYFSHPDEVIQLEITGGIHVKSYKTYPFHSIQDLQAKDHYLYVMTADGLKMYDLQPDRQVCLLQYSFYEPSQLILRDDQLYAAGGNGFIVVDVKNPSAPTIKVDYVDDNFREMGEELYTRWENTRTTAIAPYKDYLVAIESPYSISLYDPNHLDDEPIVGSLNEGDWWEYDLNITIQEHYALIFNSEHDQLAVIDLANPEKPVLANEAF